MSASSVKIIVNGTGGPGSGVEVDGVRIPGTHTIAFCSRVGGLSTVLIGLWAKDITAELDSAQVTITPDLIRGLLSDHGMVDTTEMGSQFRVHEGAIDIDDLAARVADILGQRAAVRAKL